VTVDDLRGMIGKRVGLQLTGELDGNTELERLKELGQRLLPPYPGENLIRPVTVPAPEAFPAVLPYEECVGILAAFYRGGVETYYGMQSRYGMTAGRKLANYSALCLVVDALSRRQVPPASWVMFSFDVWQEFGPTGSQRPPTVMWVFSLGRVVQKHDWFTNWSDKYRGGRTFFATEHLGLVKAWREMWDELLRVKPQTRSELGAIVDKHFPGDSFEKRVVSAQGCSRRLERQLLAAIQEGKLVWHGS